jgi:hypothetical protein
MKRKGEECGTNNYLKGVRDHLKIGWCQKISLDILVKLWAQNISVDPLEKCLTLNPNHVEGRPNTCP